MAQGIGVAEAQKRFSELLARGAYGRERFMIERRGRPSDPGYVKEEAE